MRIKKLMRKANFRVPTTECNWVPVPRGMAFACVANTLSKTFTTAMQSSTKRLKLKKYAVLVSYCGSGYYGMQRNAGLPTIESEIFDAFLKSEVFTKEQYDAPWTLYFQKASRTDKGVSAVKQVISCHLPNDFCERIPKINEFLPPKIRVVAAKKTTRYFDSKSYCDARTYSYLMPSYSLCPPEELTCDSFRVKPGLIEHLNKILSLYKGTHNFHNFTSQKLATDNSAHRYILEMDCGQPFEKDGLEWLVIRVKGQSFMMHQIRKMIGLAIGIMRGFATEDVVIRSFGIEKLDIPKAPGLGLMLDEVHYDRYNKRYGGDGIHEGLIWTEYAEFINNFKHEQIYPIIVETEKNEHQMLSWLQTLPMHTFSTRIDLTPKQNLSKEEEVLLSLQHDKEVPTSTYKRAAFNAGVMYGGKNAKMSDDGDETVEDEEGDTTDGNGQLDGEEDATEDAANS